jgi:putative ABC transport system ATP-binding protein
MLHAKGLEITFNPGTPIENRVLRGLDLKIPTGQFVTVIGSNGAGKSTFLNAVSGDLMVDRGTIRIDDEDVTRRPAWERSNLVARVFQDRWPAPARRSRSRKNMALAFKRGARRTFGFSLTRSLRELFREKLSILQPRTREPAGRPHGPALRRQRQAVSLLMASLQPSRILLLDEHHRGARSEDAAFVLELTAHIVEAGKLTHDGHAQHAPGRSTTARAP